MYSRGTSPRSLASDPGDTIGFAMTIATTHRSPRRLMPKIGSYVGVRVGGSVKRARVIEDRGNIGVGGRRIVRVEFEPDAELDGEPVRFEQPVEWLVDAPA